MSGSLSALGTASRTERLARLVRVLPAPPAEVWRAWTDPDRLPGWFGPILEGTPGPEQEYVLEGRGQHGDTIVCRVLTWDPPAALRVTWRYTGETDSELRLALSPADHGGTRLVLEHAGFGPEADPVDYAAGWHMYTDNLEAHLAGTPGVADSDARWMELLPVYAASAR
ncbi:SRPBCC domain-containing protein [Streptomyces sp. TRM64462]|uniref:SRPBCC domain-containing protein n=1 Tax=Streptomyces sp. TRM64462 TaxID=2741726 RepID=UPI00158619C1|nr:SRPBCC domain-containing protein [Streptomyces sp. TRM64462]